MPGYEARFTGEITITPPLTLGEMRKPRPWKLRDLRFRQHDESREGENGYWVEVTGVAVAPFTEESFSGFDMVTELDCLLGTFGRDHAFTGFIEACGDDGDLWRLTVITGRAVQISPQIVWPDEENRDA
jgi:hypothetical protein